MARIQSERTEILPDQAVEVLLASLGSREGRPRGGLEGRGRSKALIAFALLAGHDVFPGYSWEEKRDASRERRRGVLCQSAIEIQSAVGCPFDCTYCPYSSFLCIRLDLEEFADRVSALAASHPGQALYKLNNRTDTLGLEPEYGLAKLLVERFARLPGKYLMLYSKGDEVDHLVGLEHRGKTVASFTLTPGPIAALLEEGAPDPFARIAAMGKLAKAGYPLRVRFSPVVPLVGFRERYRELISRLKEVGQPELVTLWTLSMTPFEELGRVVPLDLLDPSCVDRARGAADSMRGQKGAPFPPDVRAEIYRELVEMVSEAWPQTAVALCLEDEAVWNAVGLAMERRGHGFVCNCGPHVTPESLSLASIRRRAR